VGKQAHTRVKSLTFPKRLENFRHWAKLMEKNAQVNKPASSGTKKRKRRKRRKKNASKKD